MTADLGRARQRLREAEERHHEPVAVVGMACRFPGGVGSPEDLWDLVASGRDAIGGFPSNRGWDLDGLYHPDPDHPGGSYVRRGGFLYDADEFDAAFFGISPREAKAMNPQHRVLLEVAWELLERARIDPTSLRSTLTGVYAGAGVPGFGTSHADRDVEGHLATGNALSVLSGRISYALGLEGPAVTVDTACSSSLVAVHLACHALRQGECDLAMAGGVTVMPAPTMFTEFSRHRVLSPDERCSPFAEAANGTVFSEGAGLVLLERLSDARRNGHRVLAVVRGSAVNQDGTSNGLTAPSGLAQQRVIARALAGAGLSASEVDAVEAHGTGTALGDPLEAQALLATYGRDRPADRPLLLGSIKSNIGHTQGAAGVAGIIKTVMAMRHGTLPASLNVDEPTRNVDWSSGAVRLLTGPAEWPATGRPRRAGVSAFGMSGTNAHLILEEAPEAARPDEAEPAAAAGGPLPWVLSARNPLALRDAAAALAGRVADGTAASPADVGWSLVETRAVFEHRAVVVGEDAAALADGLDALARGEEHPALRTGHAGRTVAAPVLVFPGQGSQWAGMGAGLLASSPVFAARIADCERALEPHVDWSLTAVLRGDEDAADLGRLDVVQPALWAMMVSLAAVWAAHGVVPAAVVGHSQGEIAAACVAGALTLDDAARLVAVRSRVLMRLAGQGAMAPVGTGEQDAGRLLAELGGTAGEVVVAGVNGPRSVVLSGPPDQIRAVVDKAKGEGLQARMIEASAAGHSPQIDRITPELGERLSGIGPVPAQEVAFYSTVTGARLDTAELGTGYWLDNMRRPVRFADAVGAVLADGHRVFIEVSPHPVLMMSTQECIDEAGADGVTVPTLRRGDGDRTRLLLSVAQAFAAGAEVDWAAAFPSDPSPDVVDLPTYAFQRERFWPSGRDGGQDARGLGLSAAGHPLLGAALELADGDGHLLTGRLTRQSAAWLTEHEFNGTLLLPGTALLEWALRAADGVGCTRVEELTLHTPLLLPGPDALRVQVVVGAADDDGRRDVHIYTRPDDDADTADSAWVCHAAGVLTTAPATTGAWDGPWPPAAAEPLDIGGFYERLRDIGYAYGPAFQGLRAAWRDGDDLLAEIGLPEQADAQDGFGVHPALLDAALHPIFLTGRVDAGSAWLPFAWNGVSLHASGATVLRVRLTPLGDGLEQGFLVQAADPAGLPVLDAESVRMRPAAGPLEPAPGHRTRGLYSLGWVAAASTPQTPPDAVWTDLGALTAALDSGTPPPSVVVTEVTVAEDGEDPSAAARDTVEHVLGLLQRWLAEPRLADARLVLVTRGAVAATTDDAVDDAAAPDLAGAAVWGLIRSAQAEEPGRFVLVDLDGPGGDEDRRTVAEALASDEPQTAVRGGRVLVPRLARAAAAPPAGGGTPDPDGTILITGGTGTLGALVAEHLAGAWRAGHLLLVSRSGMDAPGAPALAARLAELGADVRIAAADVTDPAAVAGLLDGIDPAHPLTGVVHAAGALDDATIPSQTPEGLERAWAAKAAAAANLDAATAGLPLTMFVVFSSAAAVMGSPGQANYAAANAFCDALAARRRDRGLPGLSIAWGLWADASGMTAHLSQAGLESRMGRSGIVPMSSDRALSLLDAAWASAAPAVVAADVSVAGLAADQIPVVLRGLAGPVRRRAASGADATGLAARLDGLDEDARLGLVSRIVRESVAGVLAHRSPDGVDAETNFRDLGFDSLTAVELRNRLAASTGLRLPATLVFDHPTPVALTRHLCAQLAGTGRAAPGPAAVVRADEPVAIVGMACRYPGGVRGPEDLWDLVASGGDAIGDFPSNRGWDLAGLFHPDADHPGTSYVRTGGFLHDADRFDAGFFGISPREASAADPQQRVLLETAWELLERAGIDPATLKGTSTGVYAGAMYHDYAAGPAGGDAAMEGHAWLAGSGSVISGRLAYTLGLEGPAVTVDTACSSSLVAVHLASQALRQGECDLALAGGVTVMATPDPFSGFSRQGGLSPDGRCKSFAAAADGTGISEGAGLLLLERLSDARRRGHRVLAVVRGSAVNQDGASNGLTAPNGPSQQRVIGQALAGAGLSASDVDAVEAHGTGTRLGDPIEAQALLAAYGRGRAEDRPLWLGSVKSNIGHAQAAAGVAGVIKMVMAMRHGTLPASLHIDEPTPHVDWDAGAVRLLTEPTEWPLGDRPRRAGISSFGASGTNAHVIVEQAPEPPRPEYVPPVDGVVPWVVSARSEAALREQVARLGGVAGDPVEVGWSLVSSRSSFEWRSVAVGESREELLAGLEAGVGKPVARGECVWLFSGQGGQRVGMGAGLYERFPVFAEAFDEVCGLLDPGLKQVVFSGPSETLEDTTFAQTGLFAVQVALARLLESAGVRPDVVVGHSVGEVAAAHVAGVLDLADACRLVSARARLMGGLPAGGAMAAIQADPGELAGGLPEGVGVAAVNTPGSTVVSGPADLVAQVRDAWAVKGRKTKSLPVSHGFHSVLMEPMLAGFGEAIGGLGFGVPVVPMVSTLTGELVGEEIAAAQYWVRQVREPVRFLPAIVSLGERAGVFIELGPDPVLATAAQQILDERQVPSVAALHRDRPDTRAFGAALGTLHVHGIDIDWTGWFPDRPRPRTIDLPTYAFQRERYWLPSGKSGREDAAHLGLTSTAHPLLGASVELAEGGACLLTGRLSPAEGDWTAEHVVAGAVLLPGAAILEWVLRAADEAGCGGVEELVLQAPLVLGESGPVRVQVAVGAAAEDGRRDVHVYSRPEHDPDPEWTCHADGVLFDEAAAPPGAPAGQWPPPGAEPIDVSGFYERAEAAGHAYGPAFRGLRAAWRHGRDLLGEVVLPEAAGDLDGFGIHPALLDAALHTAVLDGESDGRAWVPFAWSGVALHAVGARTVRVRASLLGDRLDQGLKVLIADTAGSPVLSVESLRIRDVDPRRLRDTGGRGPRELMTLEWGALPEAAGEGPPPARAGWAVLGEDLSGLERLAAADPVPSTVLAKLPAGARDPQAATGRALRLVQDWLAEPRFADARLALVTRHAVDTDDHRVDAPAAGVWGLLRSAQLEHPGRFVLLDAGSDTDDDVALVDAVRRAMEADESQVTLRDGRVRVPRLTRAGASPRLVLPVRERAWRLFPGGAATLESVTAEAFPEALEPLGPGQVRVEVRAAGINFRDVLVALGMVPSPGGIGGEGAGVVVETGPQVAGLKAGDPVMGLFAGAFGTTAVADARMVTRIPEGWGFREAAATPVAFLTAWYGLVDLAGLRAGESVLVHAATGGVGRAAVQIARRLGAEVFATASPGKHAVLEEMGVDAGHRASSRDLDFEEVIRSATGGEGVDVVLNALAGPFTDASLRLLRDGGRFVEMGKTDIRRADEVTAAHPGVSYQVFDLIADAGPDRIGQMLETVTELLTAGDLHAPPLESWPLEKARDALRYMSQARHTGKLVLDVPARLDPDGTVLITGGTGTLGALTAEHLAREWGVRHLVLVSRRGIDAPGAADLVGLLGGLGARATVAAADVADPAALRAVVAGIDPAHPLTGVVHAAGVVDDGVVTSLDPGRLAAVWGVKATAAQTLHAVTADRRLALFTIFSSAAAAIGSPGQGNYAAANAYCDALAARRRAEGLPGLSIGWGSWAATSGMTEHLADADLARMDRLGMRAMSTERALALLDAASRHGGPHLVAVDLGTGPPGGLPARSLPPVLRGLAAAGPQRRRAASAAAPAGGVAERLAGEPKAERLRILLSLVREEAATALGHSDPGSIPPDVTFKDLGFDSLIAVELRNRLSAATGLRLPAALVFDFPDAAAVAGHLLTRLAPDAGAEPAGLLDPVLDEVARLEGTLDGLVAADLDRGVVTARLEELLTRWRGASRPPDGADGAGGANGASAAERLGVATADQVLDFIDNELGMS
ncbi:type I polyketide synthase [Actinomadura graeca]|uniref:type I polyketide synthase n=1 Tax=Actinomadura graeca TaxID=2750812 RepID=UPI0023599905|nr:type I polyketide synthase [Actinomadura graeca]